MQRANPLEISTYYGCLGYRLITLLWLFLPRVTDRERERFLLLLYLGWEE